jgi:hypothetical protein
VRPPPLAHLLGRSVSAVFEGEEGVGDGVSREAAQVGLALPGVRLVTWTTPAVIN